MAKARRRVRDTWREKSWYDIKIPVEFGEKDIGSTPARDSVLFSVKTAKKSSSTIRIF